MRRLLPLFCLLIMAMTVWSATAAQAADACAEVADSAAGHFEGDGDQVPADSDNETTHHHAVCHGHCSATADTAVADARILSQPLRARPFDVQWLSGSDPAQALRPPIAWRRLSSAAQRRVFRVFRSPKE